MVFAAGVGRRLRPLTDEMPKALVSVGGVTQLERTLRRLEEAKASRIVVNAHHHADQIGEVLANRISRPGTTVIVSPEAERPLETGGGLLLARALFEADESILLHNVDIITTVDLVELVAAHESSDALATLAVHERPASRYLLFDEAGLQGRLDVRNGRRQEARPPIGTVRRRAFSGIHVIERRLLDLIEEDGVFSIIDVYLRLAGAGHAIRPLDVTGCQWLEIGTPERLARARKALGG